MLAHVFVVHVSNYIPCSKTSLSLAGLLVFVCLFFILSPSTEVKGSSINAGDICVIFSGFKDAPPPRSKKDYKVCVLIFCVFVSLFSLQGKLHECLLLCLYSE